ncbi:MAG: tetratricopeptide repeat protein [Elusimicrobia bacterium]|nr:tetratricopeptide repeat protein [Elusimicrobiota bacterium]
MDQDSKTPAACSPSPSGASIPASPWRRLALPALLAALTLALYGDSLNDPLVFDSTIILTPSRLEWTLQHFGIGRLFDLRALTWLSFAGTYFFFGMKVFWHNLLNALLHASNVALIFIFLERLFALALRPVGQDTPARNLAFSGAALFAVHPISVYATAYLNQRSILLATFFALLSLISFLKGFAQDSRRHRIWSAVFYFLSVHSKEHAVMLPLAACSLVPLISQAQGRAALRKLWPLCLLYAAIAGEIILRARGVLGKAYEPYAAEILGSLANDRPAHLYALSVLTQSWMFFRYLWLWLCPHTGWMSVDMVLPMARGLLSWPETLALPCLGAYACAALALLRKRGRLGLAGFGLLFPLLLFPTEFAAVRTHEQFVLYRSYLWMPGFFAVLPLAAALLSRKARIPLMICGLLYLAMGARDRLATFRDPVSLWADAAAKLDPKASKNSPAYRPIGCLAQAYAQRGDQERAIPLYRRALELNPRSVENQYDLGNSLRSVGRCREAVAHYAAAVQLKPFADGFNNLGLAFACSGDIAPAIAAYRQAIRVSPDSVEALVNLGNLLQKKGDFAESRDSYTRALRLEPNRAEIHNNLGLLLARNGAVDEAIVHFKEVVRLKPDDPQARANLDKAFQFKRLTSR